MDHRCHFHEGIGQDLSNFIKRKVKGNHKAKKKKKRSREIKPKRKISRFWESEKYEKQSKRKSFPFFYILWVSFPSINRGTGFIFSHTPNLENSSTNL